MGTPASGKIVMALAWVLILTWLPGGSPSWWRGPAPCLGQTAKNAEQNPERLKVDSFAAAGFLGTGNQAGNSLTETGSRLAVNLTNSFQGFTGIAQINQSAGSLNNQANVLGVAGANRGMNLSRLESTYQSREENNTLNTSGNHYRTTIGGNSFEGGAGVAMVNQTAGNLNTQLNAFNLTFGPKRLAGVQGLTDHELKAIQANDATGTEVAKPNKYAAQLDLEGGAFKNFTGLVSTSQVAGNRNQVSTVFNVNVQTLP